MENNNFGTGAIKDKPDIRDYQFGDEIGHASTPFDWSKGYDVETETGFKIKIKDQGISSSCGGQAWSYYGQAWDAIIDKENSEKSAKYIYSQTFVGSGGSAGRTNCDVVINQGWGPESLTPSYKNGQPLSEQEYQRPQDITQLARLAAGKDRAFVYANVSLNIDTIAQAMRDNHGLVIGITGKNNGTWSGKYPKAPDSFVNSWNHWLYAGKAKLIDGKKHLGVFQSWGEDVGDRGIQWISEDYINTRINNYPVIFSVWTVAVRTEVIPPAFSHHFSKTLKYKMIDPEVKQLQMALKIDGCFPQNVDTVNNFGSTTLASVKKFQQKYGLVPDGVVGPKSNEILNKLFDK